jgi:hypothetical protein
MSSLQSLALSKNELLGDLSVLQALPSLSHVYADRNLFEGTLQETFDYMPQLKELDMSSNKLKGTLPEYFFKMTNLQILDLSDNEMDGPIPNAIPEGSGLKYLSLFANGFDGTIPSSIENAQSLTHVDLSANYLQGTIPTVLGSLTNLKYLFFGGKSLHGWTHSVVDFQFAKFARLVAQRNGLDGKHSFLLDEHVQFDFVGCAKEFTSGHYSTQACGKWCLEIAIYLAQSKSAHGNHSVRVFASFHSRHALGGSQFLYRKLE